MAQVNSTVGGSLLLTTLLTNCHVVPVTETLVPMKHDRGSGIHRASSQGSSESSWPGVQGDLGADGGGGGAAVMDTDGGRSFKEASKAGRGRGNSGSGKPFPFLDQPSTTTANTTKTLEGSDPGAVMYIIVVLVFYSTGVMVMIVRYLRTEKKELEEEVTLENFFKSMPDKRVEKEHRVNLMAIRAFHTLTSISYDDDDLDGLDLDSDTETESRDRKSLDATSSQPLLVTDL